MNTGKGHLCFHSDAGIFTDFLCGGHHNHTPVGGAAAADGPIAHRQRLLVLENRRGLLTSAKGVLDTQMKVVCLLFFFNFIRFETGPVPQIQATCTFCNSGGEKGALAHAATCCSGGFPPSQSSKSPRSPFQPH